MTLLRPGHRPPAVMTAAIVSPGPNTTISETCRNPTSMRTTQERPGGNRTRAPPQAVPRGPARRKAVAAVPFIMPFFGLRSAVLSDATAAASCAAFASTFSLAVSCGGLLFEGRGEEATGRGFSGIGLTVPVAP